MSLGVENMSFYVFVGAPTGPGPRRAPPRPRGGPGGGPRGGPRAQGETPREGPLGPRAPAVLHPSPGEGPGEGPGPRVGPRGGPPEPWALSIGWTGGGGLFIQLGGEGVALIRLLRLDVLKGTAPPVRGLE